MFDFAQLLEDGPQQRGAIDTVRQQARLDQRDTDELVWDQFFTRADVGSVKINEMRLPDDRFVASRREWDGEGHVIPLRTPDFVDMEMIPISTYFQYGEYELQRFAESRNGNEQLMVDAIEAELPDRVDSNVDAVMRRVEMDTHNVWQLGQIEVQDPQTEQVSTASFQFDSNRYPTDDWTGGNNAWTAFLDHTKKAQDYVASGVQGCLLDNSILQKIKQDAPTDIAGNEITLRALRERVQEELNQSFTIVEADHNSADTFDGAGNSTTRQTYYNEGKVTYVPGDGRVGRMAAAPIARAYSYRSAAGDRVDVRNVAVFYVMKNDGKNMKVEFQLNWMPIPYEEKVYVVETGI